MHGQQNIKIIIIIIIIIIIFINTAIGWLPGGSGIEIQICAVV